MNEPGNGPSEAGEVSTPKPEESVAVETGAGFEAESTSPSVEPANQEADREIVPETAAESGTAVNVKEQQASDSSQTPAFQLLAELGAFDKTNSDALADFSQKTFEELDSDLSQLAEMYADDPKKVDQIKRYFISQILDPSASEGARAALLSQDIDSLVQMRAAKQSVTDAEDENFDDTSRQIINEDEAKASKDVDLEASQTSEAELKNRWLGQTDEKGQRQGGLIYEALATHLSGEELAVARQKLSQPGTTPEEAMALLTGKDINDEKQRAEIEEDVGRFKKVIAEYVGPFMFDIAFKHNDFGAFLDFLLTNRDYGFGGSAGEFSQNGETDNGIGKTDFENLLKNNDPSQRKEFGKNLEKAITDSGEEGLVWHGFQLTNKEQVLQKAREGDVVSIKLILDHVLHFLFDDSGKTIQRWGVTRKILGENLFPTKHQPLSREVANYLAQEFNKPREEWWKGTIIQGNVTPLRQSSPTPQAKAA